MENWLKGLAGTSTGLLVIVVTIATGYYISAIGAVVAFICAVLVAGAFLGLIYAVEKNDFRFGVAVPLVAALAIIVGIFGQPPVPSTFGLCFLTAIFGIIMIQEGE